MDRHWISVSMLAATLVTMGCISKTGHYKVPVITTEPIKVVRIKQSRENWVGSSDAEHRATVTLTESSPEFSEVRDWLMSLDTRGERILGVAPPGIVRVIVDGLTVDLGYSTAVFMNNGELQVRRPMTTSDEEMQKKLLKLFDGIVVVQNSDQAEESGVAKE